MTFLWFVSSEEFEEGEGGEEEEEMTQTSVVSTGRMFTSLPPPVPT